MKRFEFSLQKLADYRGQELDRQKNALSALQSELQRIIAETERLRAEVLRETASLNAAAQQGVSASDIMVRKRYIVTLQNDIHGKEEQTRKKQAEIDAQLGVVVEATKDVKTLEKLEEKQLEDYKAAETKENEQFIEEFVSNASLRAVSM